MSGIIQYPPASSGVRRVAEVFNGATTVPSMTELPGAVSYTLTATGTANQWQTMLSVTGPGRLNCAAITQLVGSSTIALRITADGVVIATRFGSSLVGRGALALGFPVLNPGSGSPLGFSPQPADFSGSLLIEASTSVSTPGTPAATVFIAHEVDRT